MSLLACRFSMKIWENNSFKSIRPSSHTKCSSFERNGSDIFSKDLFYSQVEFRVFLPRFFAAAMRKHCTALSGQVQKLTDRDEISTGISIRPIASFGVWTSYTRGNRQFFLYIMTRTTLWWLDCSSFSTIIKIIADYPCAFCCCLLIWSIVVNINKLMVEWLIN